MRQQVRQALENPRSFYGDDNAYTLAERGLTYPQDHALTAKFVLLDTLYAAAQLAEVDWKEAEEDVREAINDILTAKQYPARISAADRYGDLTDTLEIIHHLNRREVRPLGYALVLLDIGSDSYVFTVVPLSQQPVVAALFDQMAAEFRL